MTLDAGLYVKSGSGAGAYKSTTGAMIYKRWIDLAASNYAFKSGHSYVSLADAVTAMEGAAWDVPGGMVCLCDHRSADIVARSGLIRVTTSAYAGLTLINLQIAGIAYAGKAGGGNYQVKIQTNNTGVPDSSWSWCVSSPDYVGSDAGTVNISCSVTMQNYLFAIMTFETWTDPLLFYYWQWSRASGTVRLFFA